MNIFRPEHPELFALESGKNSELDFDTLASTNINQSVEDLVKMNTTIRSWMNLIMDLIGQELSELSVLELEKLPYLTCLQSSICKNKSIRTKLGYNVMNNRSRIRLIMGKIRPEHS